MKRSYSNERSQFFALENHFLNTFFSGLYFSATDFIAIGREVGLNLQMHSREMLIKELLNQSNDNGKLSDVIAAMNRVIDERITLCHRLSLEYPNARTPLAKLAQKATGSKALLAREARGNPYEH
ncbi:hypothetical protein [Sulfuricurvum sp.]|uniref:hypothetical protein n=1 Tax=Sulfuricurvum sp. TaxID=2025608 RepID=UPI0019AE65EE|nr:hypothetical protein [Sulfuricurvum sp.]MBD3798804.1 hypothetical protein [Campylobacterota bacterium]MBD3806693.1 hypothetical protein [Sulfuricurvum sp.]